MQGTFTLTITQNDGSLGGSYSIVGELSDGFDVLSMQGTGVLSGSIAAGNNPSVNIRITSGVCNNVSTNWSGAYDSTNRVITLNGNIPVTNGNCQVVLNYGTTGILRR